MMLHCDTFWCCLLFICSFAISNFGAGSGVEGSGGVKACWLLVGVVPSGYCSPCWVFYPIFFFFSFGFTFSFLA